MGEQTDLHDLTGRVAVVTGGGSGIGEAIAVELAAAGATVAVLDLDEGAAKLTATLCGGGLAVAVDVTDSDAVDAAAARVEAEAGPIAVWVNNAGITDMVQKRLVNERIDQRAQEIATGGEAVTRIDALVRLDDERWRRMISVHLDGTFFGTRAAAKLMVPRGTGAIVNIASVCGIAGCSTAAHYSAAKAGILGLTRAVARELAPLGVRANAVAPGYVETPMLNGMHDATRDELERAMPVGRLARPREIAAAVCYLASDAASYVVGETLRPDGGYLTV